MIRHLYYCDHIGHQHLAAGDDELQALPTFIDVAGLTNKALKNVYDGLTEPIEPSLFKITNEAIGHGISVGVLQYGKPNPAFLGHMQKTGTWFSARKTYQQQQELARLLMSEDGKTKRSWKDFQKAAQGVISNYNQTWLKTEYNTAIRAARNGSRWQEYEANADLYPNLEYLPSRAATPRPEHKPFYHVVRPLNDEFWTKHYPPSEYNCMCGVEPSDDAVTPLPTVQPAPAPGLDHNPGQTQAVFSDTHPYTVAAKKQGADLAAIDQAGEDLQRQADYAQLRTRSDFMNAVNKTDKLQTKFKKLDHEEIAAIWTYTESDYYELNRFLRGGVIDKDAYYAALNRVLSSGLKKLPAYKKDVFRGASISKEVVDEYKSCQQRGVPIQHNYFTSTSADATKAFQENIQFIIHPRAGRRITKISKYATEDEVLFDAGTWFEVDEVEEIGDKVWIHLTELKR